MTPPQEPATRPRAALRIAFWNAVWLFAGLALIGLGGEAWQRLTVPFATNSLAHTFVPEVGRLRRPNTEIRKTNRLDFWSVSRTNSLGFLDREPPSPLEAAASCHVTMIGDSFVEAVQVTIPEKFHIRLEELAARELKQLNVTTSAFGKDYTGQIAQLAYWHEYARHLRPKLVVLAFVPNDYENNFPLWTALVSGTDPQHQPYWSAARTEDGGFRLLLPKPDYRQFMRRSEPPRRPAWKKLARSLIDASWFLHWSATQYNLRFRRGRIAADSPLVDDNWRKTLMRRPAYAPLLEDEFALTSLGNLSPRAMSALALFEEEAPFYAEALAYTAFALDEFKKRTHRAGAALVILATHRMSRWKGGLARLKSMAAERRIPVIEQADFIRRQGATLEDANWKHDDHWSPRGHQWAAEALLDWLKQNQHVCD